MEMHVACENQLFCHMFNKNLKSAHENHIAQYMGSTPFRSTRKMCHSQIHRVEVAVTTIFIT